MGAPDVLAVLSAAGLRLEREGGDLLVSPKAALTDELRGLIRAHKAELLESLQATAHSPAITTAQDRKARALAYLEQHPEVKRACFADAKVDPENIVFTVAVREPWGAVEVFVRRESFDAFALTELSLRYPDTSLFIPEH